MIKTVSAAMAAFGIAAAVVTAAGPSMSAPTVLADDSCYGQLQGSYYCYSQGGGSGSSAPEYTPVQPAYGYNNLPQCSGSSSAIAGALSGDGC
jgi:hypothetical protein